MVPHSTSNDSNLLPISSIWWYILHSTSTNLNFPFMINQSPFSNLYLLEVFFQLPTLFSIWFQVSLLIGISLTLPRFSIINYLLWESFPLRIICFEKFGKMSIFCFRPSFQFFGQLPCSIRLKEKCNSSSPILCQKLAELANDVHFLILIPDVAKCSLQSASFALGNDRIAKVLSKYRKSEF